MLGCFLAQASARATQPTTAECLAASERSLSLRRALRLLDAREQYLICSASSCPAAIREECSQQVADVKAAIPTVVFEAKDAAGNDLIDVTVRADERVLADHLDGRGLAVDPGQHVFQFETTGRPPMRKRFVIHEGEKDRRERVVFSDVTTPGPSASILAESRPSPAEPGAHESIGTRRILALVAAGVGVVSLGIGIGYGIYSISKHDQAQKGCQTTYCTDQSETALWHQAVSAGNVSTVAFIVGGIGVAGGLALWRTW
jgi:hypothetical protein